MSLKARLMDFFHVWHSYNWHELDTSLLSSSPGAGVMLCFCLMQLMWAAGEPHARCSSGASHVHFCLLGKYFVWTMQHWRIPPSCRNNFRISWESYNHHAPGETPFIQRGGQTRQGQFNILTIQGDTNGCWIKWGKYLNISKTDVLGNTEVQEENWPSVIV